MPSSGGISTGPRLSSFSGPDPSPIRQVYLPASPTKTAVVQDAAPSDMATLMAQRRARRLGAPRVPSANPDPARAPSANLDPPHVPSPNPDPPCAPSPNQDPARAPSANLDPPRAPTNPTPSLFRAFRTVIGMMTNLGLRRLQTTVKAVAMRSRTKGRPREQLWGRRRARERGGSANAAASRSTADSDRSLVSCPASSSWTHFLQTLTDARSRLLWRACSFLAQPLSCNRSR